MRHEGPEGGTKPEHERGQALPRAGVDSSGQTAEPVPAGRALVCRVQHRLCLLPLEHVVEAMRALPIEAVAGAPPYVRGLSIVRGVPTPVVDVARLLDSSAAGQGDCKRFVMFKGGRHLVALAVDDVVGVRSISPEAMRDLPPLLKDAADEVIGSIGTLHAELFLALRGSRLVPDASWFTPSVSESRS